jgi:dTMP kinase
VSELKGTYTFESKNDLAKVKFASAGDTGIYPGTFVVLEGGDYAGKSTQVQQLATHFRAAGRHVTTLVEPGGSHTGQLVRRYLLERERPPEVELIALWVARLANLEINILPALRRGEVVICDRFTASTYAYQGLHSSFNVKEFYRLHEEFGVVEPDLSILLTVNIEERMRRAWSRQAIDPESRFDKAVEKAAIIQSRFCEYFSQPKGNRVIVSGDKSIENVSLELIQLVTQVVENKLGA